MTRVYVNVESQTYNTSAIFDPTAEAVSTLFIDNFYEEPAEEEEETDEEATADVFVQIPLPRVVKFRNAITVFTIPRDVHPRNANAQCVDTQFVASIGEPREETINLVTKEHIPKITPPIRFFKLIRRMLYAQKKDAKPVPLRHRPQQILSYLKIVEKIASKASDIHTNKRLNTIWQHLNPLTRDAVINAANDILHYRYDAECFANIIRPIAMNSRVAFGYHTLFEKINDKWFLEKTYNIFDEAVVTGMVSKESYSKYLSYIDSYLRIIYSCPDLLDHKPDTTSFN